MTAANQFLLTAGQKILFAGHSLMTRRDPPYHDTWPFLRLIHGDRTWCDDFAEILFCLRPDLALDFHTVEGATMAQILDRYEACVAAYRPDWVFLATGDMDARLGVPIEAFRAQVRDFVRRVGALSGCRVACLGGATTPQEGLPESAFDAVSAPYHAVLEGIASDGSCIYIDYDSTLVRKQQHLRRAYAGHSVHIVDGHLNAIGNMIVAWKVLTTLGFAWQD